MGSKMLPYDEHTPMDDLQQMQLLVGQGAMTCRVTEAALLGGEALGMDRNAIVAVVLSLEPGDFYKTMEADLCPGLWQDVYHCRVNELELYIKLQVDHTGRAVVIQFKRR
jgi:motility quorum-sensing regulator/GCU-specific mRNA interferase toxin